MDLKLQKIIEVSFHLFKQRMQILAAVLLMGSHYVPFPIFYGRHSKHINALSKFSTISSANSSLSGRLSRSVRLLSFSHVTSKEVLSPQ
jgi:hypothetical protein